MLSAHSRVLSVLSVFDALHQGASDLNHYAACFALELSLVNKSVTFLEFYDNIAA